MKINIWQNLTYVHYTWKVKVKSLSHVRLFATPWTAAHQAPPSMGFSRQEYCSGLPLPSLIQTVSSNNTREEPIHGHHQMVITKIRLIIFFAAKDEEGLYSQQKQDQKVTIVLITSSILQNSDLNWRKQGKPLGHSGMT